MKLSDQREKAFRSWSKILNPEELRSNLVRASIYLTAYELLHQALIEHLKGFFAEGFDANGPILRENYKSKVLSLHKDKMPFFASANWFRDAGALTDEDLDRIREIRDYRNFIAHNIPEVLGNPDVNVRSDMFSAIAEMVRKIDMWWIREVHIPLDPDFDAMAPDEIDTESTFSLRMAILDLLLQVADGDDEGLKRLYEQFTEKGVVH